MSGFRYKVYLLSLAHLRLHKLAVASSVLSHMQFLIIPSTKVNVYLVPKLSKAHHSYYFFDKTTGAQFQLFASGH